MDYPVTTSPGQIGHAMMSDTPTESSFAPAEPALTSHLNTLIAANQHLNDMVLRLESVADALLGARPKQVEGSAADTDESGRSLLSRLHDEEVRSQALRVHLMDLIERLEAVV